MYTPMHHNYPPHVHAVEPADTSSSVASQSMVIQSNLTAPSTSLAQSSSLSLHLPPKPNWVPCSSMHKKRKSCALPYMNSVIHNHQHQYTLTTPLPSELSTTPSSDNDPVPWKCVTSGYWTVKRKNISNFITCPDRKTWVIILLNTTQRTYINMCAHIMFILKPPLQSSHGL